MMAKVDVTLVRPDLTLKQYSSASNLAFNEKIKSLIKEGQNIYHFGFGQSPFPVLETAVDYLKKYASENDYLPVQGLATLRKGICEFHKVYDDLTFDPDDVIVAPGSKELIFLLMTVFNGDILINSPSWTTYQSQAILAGRSPLIVDSREKDGWKITPEELEKVLSKADIDSYKLLILTNPCNPTGTCYTQENLEKLTEVFRNHRVIVLSDEIYARVQYGGDHVCLSKVYPEGTILSSGMSKWAGAGGWRLGYNIFPKELFPLMSAVRNAASHSYSCAPAPMQYAFSQVLTNFPACDEYIQHTTRIMKLVGQFCTSELRSVGVKVVEPKGGYYIFPNFEVIKPALIKCGITSCKQMCELILKDAHVALMPGGPDHMRPIDELTTRLCFVNFDGSLSLSESRQRGLTCKLDVNFVKEFCAPVYGGVMALKTWVLKLTQLQ
ncbi:aspartate aminotransferase [Biomphalaria glabrata]|uniref:Aminotransferase class I/classII large domain-containing protein n=1 Tax=Biomphalaria glabrata TaxID=6526 RepID=A0A2C9JK64_BIOGL|nr:aspartate aminotransferase-like [Biomphalaria glabrata]